MPDPSIDLLTRKQRRELQGLLSGVADPGERQEILGILQEDAKARQLSVQLGEGPTRGLMPDLGDRREIQDLAPEPDAGVVAQPDIDVQLPSLSKDKRYYAAPTNLRDGQGLLDQGGFEYYEEPPVEGVREALKGSRFLREAVGAPEQEDYSDVGESSEYYQRAADLIWQQAHERASKEGRVAVRLSQYEGLPNWAKKTLGVASDMQRAVLNLERGATRGIVARLAEGIVGSMAPGPATSEAAGLPDQRVVARGVQRELRDGMYYQEPDSVDEAGNPVPGRRVGVDPSKLDVAAQVGGAMMPGSLARRLFGATSMMGPFGAGAVTAGTEGAIEEGLDQVTGLTQNTAGESLQRVGADAVVGGVVGRLADYAGDAVRRGAQAARGPMMELAERSGAVVGTLREKLPAWATSWLDDAAREIQEGRGMGKRVLTPRAVADAASSVASTAKGRLAETVERIGAETVEAQSAITHRASMAPVVQYLSQAAKSGSDASDGYLHPYPLTFAKQALKELPHWVQDVSDSELVPRTANIEVVETMLDRLEDQIRTAASKELGSEDKFLQGLKAAIFETRKQFGERYAQLKAGHAEELSALTDQLGAWNLPTKVSTDLSTKARAALESQVSAYGSGEVGQRTLDDALRSLLAGDQATLDKLARLQESKALDYLAKSGPRLGMTGGPRGMTARLAEQTAEEGSIVHRGTYSLLDNLSERVPEGATNAEVDATRKAIEKEFASLPKWVPQMLLRMREAEGYFPAKRETMRLSPGLRGVFSLEGGAPSRYVADERNLQVVLDIAAMIKDLQVQEQKGTTNATE